MTLRTQACWQVLETLKEEFSELTIGVGTVVNTQQMDRAVLLKADFAVSPGLDIHLIKCANDHSLFYLPGVNTPSEVMLATSSGLNLLKFFPAVASGGTATLNSYASPFSDVSFSPSGGITLENAREFLELPNVFCVGASWLATQQDINTKNWQAITDKARQARSLVDSLNRR